MEPPIGVMDLIYRSLRCYFTVFFCSKSSFVVVTVSVPSLLYLGILVCLVFFSFLFLYFASNYTTTEEQNHPIL